MISGHGGSSFGHRTHFILVGAWLSMLASINNGRFSIHFSFARRLPFSHGFSSSERYLHRQFRLDHFFAGVGADFSNLRTTEYFNVIFQYQYKLGQYIEKAFQRRWQRHEKLMCSKFYLDWIMSYKLVFTWGGPFFFKTFYFPFGSGLFYPLRVPAKVQNLI